MGEHCACNAAVGVRLPSDPLFLTLVVAQRQEHPNVDRGTRVRFPSINLTRVPDGLVDLPRLIHEAPARFDRMRFGIVDKPKPLIRAVRSSRLHDAVPPAEGTGLQHRSRWVQLPPASLYPRSSMEERQSTKLGPVKVRLLPWVFVRLRGETEITRLSEGRIAGSIPAEDVVSPRALGGRCLSYGQSRRFDSVTRDVHRLSSGCGAVEARSVRDREVVGSTPTSPMSSLVISHG